MIDRKLIWDKSKADGGLRSSWLCMQAGWMIIDCVARKATGLPVTILELHVVMQVVCVVFIYGFWWHRPLDVNIEAISIIDSREASPSVLENAVDDEENLETTQRLSESEAKSAGLENRPAKITVIRHVESSALFTERPRGSTVRWPRAGSSLQRP